MKKSQIDAITFGYSMEKAQYFILISRFDFVSRYYVNIGQYLRWHSMIVNSNKFESHFAGSFPANNSDKKTWFFDYQTKEHLREMFPLRSAFRWFIRWVRNKDSYD